MIVRAASASTASWVDVDRRAGRPLGQGRRGPAGLQPQADLQREDRRLDAVDRPGRASATG